MGVKSEESLKEWKYVPVRKTSPTVTNFKSIDLGIFKIKKKKILNT